MKASLIQRKKTIAPAPGARNEEGGPVRDLGWWLEVAATAILLLGSLMTAWNALEASRWGGVQSSEYARAGAQRSKWIAAESMATQYALYDVATFVNWAEATSVGDEALAAFHERRFRDEFRPAFDAWLATKPLTNPDAPSSPLVMAEYTTSSQQEALAFDALAQEAFRAGDEANRWNTRYVTNGFMAALAIFFAGMAPRFKQKPLRLVVVAAGGLLLLYAIGQAIALPFV